MPKSTTDPSLRLFTRRRAEFAAQCRRAEKSVRKILDAVKSGGDRAVLRFTKRWDRAGLRNLRVTEKEFAAARRGVTAEDLRALRTLAARLAGFYESQKMRNAPVVDSTGFYAERVTPLDRAGLYVPGGRAPLVSTLLMLACPARAAGVREIFVATPPAADGSVLPLMLAAAETAGVTAVYKMGGAQAVAAFAYGTRSVPKVDKIFGPGNLYVTVAKKLVFGDVGIDLLAGPSELVIIADESADPALVTEDLLAQAEHGPDSVSLLLSTSAAIIAAVRSQLKTAGLAGTARQIFTSRQKSLEACAAVAAGIAPEHLSLFVAEPEKLLPGIGPVGAIFLGRTAVAHGDYVAGPNHTLPTLGTARFSSPLSVEAFFRRSSILNVRDPKGDLANLGARVAGWEGLKHHAESLRLRLNRG
ncbi:histidinol dehydrogenase [bacterium]|nr:histidinol dehydrogenase [bacterium]